MKKRLIYELDTAELKKQTDLAFDQCAVIWTRIFSSEYSKGRDPENVMNLLLKMISSKEQSYTRRCMKLVEIKEIS